MYKFLLLQIVLTGFMSSAFAVGCSDKGYKLKTRVFQMNRDGTKDMLVIGFPKTLSIHSGQFEEFVVESGEQKAPSSAVFNYQGKNHKSKKSLNLSIDSGILLSKNKIIKKFINKWVIDSPGILTIELVRKKKVLCKEIVKIYRGD